MKIEYSEELDELAWSEIQSKGYLTGIKVSLDDGSCHPVTVYEPVRLSQDLTEECRRGHAGLYEPGLIVAPEVTRTSVELAITEAIQSGLFD